MLIEKIDSVTRAIFARPGVPLFSWWLADCWGG